jgi:hypothetical protein
MTRSVTDETQDTKEERFGEKILEVFMGRRSYGSGPYRPNIVRESLNNYAVVEAVLLEEMSQVQGKKGRGELLPEWHSQRFGLRWKPRQDLLDVPDVPGVFVLFFPGRRRLVRGARNLFRALLQSRRAPGRSFHSFSWIEVIPPEARVLASRLLQQRSYDELWEDIRKLEDGQEIL